MDKNLKYDHRLKFDVVNGIIPKEFKKMITTDIICEWKKENWSRRIGYDYYNKKEENLRVLNSELNQLEKKVARLEAENETLRLVCKISGEDNKLVKLLNNNKEAIVECIERNKKLFKIKDFASWINISPCTYSVWKQKVKGDCKYTKIYLCAKGRHNQISFQEEQQIVNLLRDERYKHYSLTSLMLMARYENLVHASSNVWNRVKRKYNINYKLQKKIKKKYPLGIRANYPNQYLHADITEFRTTEGKIYYLYFVKDNFSRFIKSWLIADRISAEIRLLTFEHALSDLKKGANFDISFITDAGTENTANIVVDSIRVKKNVRLLIARKGTPFSNCMIERFFFDLKYRYLYKYKICSLKELKKIVTRAVDEHNNKKRFKMLDGQTPWEVYNSLPNQKEILIDRWKMAKEQRRQKTTSLICCVGKITPIT